MFFDQSRVGALAARPADFRAGRPAALFKVLIAATMFQRRQDTQIMRILRGLSPGTAREVGSLGRLARLAASSPCPHLASNAALISRCDLRKDPVTKEGTCAAYPDMPCHLKRHTEALRRYGHFGKVPTSVALAIREEGARDLRGLYRRALRAASSPLEAARTLEAELSRAWRVSQKIDCMFLSVAANPELGDRRAPWTRGVDWNHFVVVDSNVDLFLARIGYRGPWSYDRRRGFIQALARRVDLQEFRPELRPYNARLVQQAMYLFMSTSNRRALGADCAHRAPASCASCQPALRSVCPLRG